MVKKGQDFYRVSVDDDGKCELDVWRVSTINKNGIYLTQVNEFTWGNLNTLAGRGEKQKRFTKEKKMGWLPNIWAGWRKYASSEESIKATHGMHTTKLSAWKDPRLLRYLDGPEDVDAKARAEKAIKSAITRLKTAKTTKKGA